MTDLKRTLKCSNCGMEATISLGTELVVSELIFSGKCPKCGSSMQVTYSIVGGPAPVSGSQQQASAGQPSEMVNLDESLFPPEVPSDTIKDLMED